MQIQQASQRKIYDMGARKSCPFPSWGILLLELLLPYWMLCLHGTLHQHGW